MTGNKRRMHVIAHRCRGYGASENSLLALKRALASPVDEVEIDLQLTKDNEYVMIHNPWFKNGRGKTYINDWTLKDLFDKHTKHKHDFATLEQIFETFKQYGEGKLLNLDIKTVGEEKKLVQEIKKHRLTKRIIIISWIPSILKEVKKHAPNIITSFSFRPLPRFLEKWTREVDAPTNNKHIWYVNSYGKMNVDRHPRAMHEHHLSHLPKKLPADRINLVPTLWVRPRIIRDAKKRKLYVTTVGADTKFSAWIMRKWGVDATITNKPRRFVY